MKHILFAVFSLVISVNTYASAPTGTWEGVVAGTISDFSYIRIHMHGSGGYVLIAGYKEPHIYEFTKEQVSVDEKILKVVIPEDSSTKMILVFSIEEGGEAWLPSVLRGSLFEYWNTKSYGRVIHRTYSFDLAEIREKSLLEKVQEKLDEHHSTESR